MTDRTVYIAVTPAMRRVLATMAENLVDMLDQLDGDENLEEPGDLEPWLSWPEYRGLSQLDKSIRADDDREVEDEHGGDILDEPHDDDVFFGPDNEPNGDEQDCNLAGATTELEFCSGDHDGPGLIAGGHGQ